MSDRWIPERPEYYVQTGSMFDNPHGVPWPEIVRMIRENPPEVSAQTVFGKYVELSGLVFTGEMIQNAIDRALPRVLGNTYIDEQAVAVARTAYGQKPSGYEEGEWGDHYHTGVDFARQTDFTVITTLDCSMMPARLVYYRRLNRVPWETIYGEVGKVRELFGPNILCDGSGPGGDVVMDALESRYWCPVHQRTTLAGTMCQRGGKPLAGCRTEQYLDLGCAERFAFSASTKKELVEHLRNCLSMGYDATVDGDFGYIRVPPIVQLEEEVSFYAWDDKKLQTDALFSLALAAWSGLEDRVAAAYVGRLTGQ